MKRVLILVVFALLPGPALAQAPEISDSAGVRVVTNPPPDPSRVFRLTDPSVTIGRIEGAREYLLFGVRQGTVLDNGVIVILNAGTQELRFFDPAGRYLRTAGRRGEGPGEFIQPLLVGSYAGDSLLTYDLKLKRASVFDTMGTFVRTYPVPVQPPYQPVPMGLLSDGRMVTRQPMQPNRAAPPGRQRPSEPVNRIATDGATLDPLGVFPGVEMVVLPTTYGAVPFGAGLHVTARGSRIAVGNDDAYSIRVYDATGRLLHVVRQTRAPVSTKSGDLDRYVGLYPDARPNHPLYAQMRQPNRFPAYGSPCAQCLWFDRLGNLWVKEYHAPWDVTEAGKTRNEWRKDAMSTWQAFDSEGVFLGRLEVPASLIILDIGKDWLLGKVLDDLDVEHVVLYGLERP